MGRRKGSHPFGWLLFGDSYTEPPHLVRPLPVHGRFPAMQSKIPRYPYKAKTAQARGELDKWRESFHENCACTFLFGKTSMESTGRTAR